MSRERGTTISVTVLAALMAANGLDAQKPAQQTEVASIAREAQDALSREDWEGAIRGYEKLIKIAPGVAEFYTKLGMAYHSAGQPHDAVPALRQALKLSPGLAQARDLLAASLAESGQCKEALPHLKKVAPPRTTDKIFKRTVEVDGLRCAMALNQMDEAMDFIRLLRHDFPHDPEALYLAVHVFSDLSIRASQELILQAPSSYQVHLLNAEALETQGKWEEAAMEYRNILARNPRVPGMHYRLGRLLLSQPKTPASVDEVRREFEEELKTNPANPGAEYVLGELARQAHQWPEAIEHFSRATRLDAGLADAFIGLGRSLISAGRAAEAVAPLETAVRLQPENPAAHFHLATAYRRTGRKEDAEKESALHRQTSARARQATDDIQTGIVGRQKAEP